MKIEIKEYDKDYNSYSGSETLEFASLKEAEDYCKKASWSGYSYSVGKVVQD